MITIGSEHFLDLLFMEKNDEGLNAFLTLKILYCRQSLIKVYVLKSLEKYVSLKDQNKKIVCSRFHHKFSKLFAIIFFVCTLGK